MITSCGRDGLVTLRSTRSRDYQHDATKVIGRRRPSADDQQFASSKIGNGRPDLRRDHRHCCAGVQQSPDS
jgi:hypothetical protein